MRFKLGPSKRERREYENNWQPWFAWFPVRLEYLDGRGERGGCWLETIACRRDSEHLEWEYRPLSETHHAPLSAQGNLANQR